MRSIGRRGLAGARGAATGDVSLGQLVLGAQGGSGISRPRRLRHERIIERARSRDGIREREGHVSGLRGRVLTATDGRPVRIIIDRDWTMLELRINNYNQLENDETFGFQYVFHTSLSPCLARTL